MQNFVRQLNQLGKMLGTVLMQTELIAPCRRAPRPFFSAMSSLGNSDESASNDHTLFPVYDIVFRLESK